MNKVFLISFFLVFTAVSPLSGAGKDSPLLDYDFSAHEVIRERSREYPQFAQNPVITVPERALLLDGKNFITVPGGEKIFFRKELTLYALVKFLPRKDPRGKEDPLDMIFFRNNHLLLGRNGKRLYFNLGDGKKYRMSTYGEEIPLHSYCQLAATVRQETNGLYEVKLFINGTGKAHRRIRSAELGAQMGKQPLFIGKGWGKAWNFTGILIKVQIRDRAMTEKEIAEDFLKIKKKYFK